MSSIEESIQRMRVLNKEQEVAELRKQVTSLEAQLATAQEAAQWYFDATMGAIDDMEKLAPRLGIPSNITHSQRIAVWAYAQENYPFIDITPLKRRQQDGQQSS